MKNKLEYKLKKEEQQITFTEQEIRALNRNNSLAKNDNGELNKEKHTQPVPTPQRSDLIMK